MFSNNFIKYYCNTTHHIRHIQIGMDAVNDSLILESFMFFLLRKHFRNSPEIYMPLVFLYSETGLRCVCVRVLPT